MTFTLHNGTYHLDVTYHDGALTMAQVLPLYDACQKLVAAGLGVRRLLVVKQPTPEYTWEYRLEAIMGGPMTWTQRIRYANKTTPLSHVTISTDEWPDTILPVHIPARIAAQALLRAFDVETLEFAVL